MNLDVNTLFLVTIYVEAILGLLLLFAWLQNTAITAVAWWGFAHLLRAGSIMLLYRAKDNGRNRVEVASIELILDHAKRGAADLIAAAGVPASGKPAAKSAA
jgi:hypothetical protein